MGIVKKASFKSTDAIQAPGSIMHKPFLIDSILKCGASTHSFSFLKFSIILKIPSGFGLKKILENRSPSIPVFASFITHFFKNVLIFLSKISISILFLGCPKFELLIGSLLKSTFKPCCTILSIYLSFITLFQFSKWNLMLPALNFSARSYSFLISLSLIFSSSCVGPCYSSHRSCFVLMGSSSCLLKCMELMSYCCKGFMMNSYFYNSEVYLSNYQRFLHLSAFS